MGINQARRSDADLAQEILNATRSMNAMNRQHAIPSRQHRAGQAPLSALEEHIVDLLAKILVEDVQAETVKEGTLSHRVPCKPLDSQGIRR